MGGPAMCVILALFGDGAACSAQATQPAQSPDPGKGPPPARIGHVAAAVDEKLYVFGGLANDPREDHGGSGWSYDPAQTRWALTAPMPTPRVFAASAVLDGRVVLLGGIPEGSRAYTATVEVYDPRLNTWEKLPDMPIARSRCGAATIAGRLFAVSGLEGSDDQCRTGVRLDEYNPTTRRWTRRCDIPHGRHAFAAVALDGRLYVLGGYLDESGRMTPCNMVESYDPKTDSWRTEPSMNCTRSWFAAVVHEHAIIALGGLPDGPPGPERLLSDARKWDSLSQPDVGGRRFAAVAIRDVIYVVGGEGRPGDFLQTIVLQAGSRP